MDTTYEITAEFAVMGQNYLTQKGTLFTPAPEFKSREKGAMRPRGLQGGRQGEDKSSVVGFFRVVNGEPDTTKEFRLPRGYKLKTLTAVPRRIDPLKEVLAICAAKGCDVVSTANYYRVSHHGLAITQVSRTGDIWFSRDPEIPWLRDYLAVKNRQFNPYYVSVRGLIKKNQLDVIGKLLDVLIATPLKRRKK